MPYPSLWYGSYMRLSRSESLQNQLAKAVAYIYQKCEKWTDTEAAGRNAKEHINQLLEDVWRAIVYDWTERFRQGKELNIFRVRRILSDEVEVYCLIRGLLGPKGSHEQDSIFLRLLLEALGWAGIRQITGENYNKATVTSEVLTENGRHTSLLIKMGRYTPPIEAKICATNQGWQCSDYYNFVVNYDPGVVIYYLTPDGYKSSDNGKNGLRDA